jgi:hypothetical protein
MVAFAKDQPKAGDVILHCGHIKQKRTHWWKVEPPIDFERPDGTSGLAPWVIACDACAQQAEYNAEKVQIRGDGTWVGDAPVLRASN